MSSISIIVAITENFAIGKGNSLLFHISDDLKHFKRHTIGHPVIMGYKTFLSMGSRALPNRRNIVINTRESAPTPVEGIEFAHSLSDAIAMCGTSEEVFIIGGGKVYTEAMPLCDRMIVTHIKSVVEDADTFFPRIDESIWTMSKVEGPFTDPKSGLNYRFCEYTKQIPRP